MIKEDNTRILFLIDKELKAKLKEIANEENRSLSNLVYKTLKDFVNTKN